MKELSSKIQEAKKWWRESPYIIEVISSDERLKPTTNWSTMLESYQALSMEQPIYFNTVHLSLEEWVRIQDENEWKVIFDKMNKETLGSIEWLEDFHVRVTDGSGIRLMLWDDISQAWWQKTWETLRVELFYVATHSKDGVYIEVYGVVNEKREK